jgi:cytochrome P450
MISRLIDCKYFISAAIYRLYLHPLSKFPGPSLWAAFRFPFVYNMWQGRLPYRIRELHDRYGTIVRTGPNELSFTHEDAWKDIYSKRESSRPPQWHGKLPGVDANTLVSAPAPDHARFRKAFGPGLSESSVRSQEPVITRYIDKLVGILRRESKRGEENNIPVNLAEWINFTTFDIMGDLGWGASFDCLETGSYHPWILVVLWYKGLLIGVTLKFYPLLGALMSIITPASAQDGVKMVVETSRANVTARLKKSSERPDLMSAIIKHNETDRQHAISEEEMVSNSSTIIVAGSDPLASVVAGALTYLIGKSEAMARLESEIRSSFQSEEEITTKSTKKLPYLQAVLLETLRLCPPVPDNMRRVVSKEGAMIAGRFIPGGTVVGITAYAAFRAARTFPSPDEFAPARWLQSDSDIPEYAGFHPFGFGPRSCAGQALAWAEMRLLLTRLIWSFDIRDTPARTVRPWTSQKIYWTWQRDALQVSVRAASEVGAQAA